MWNLAINLPLIIGHKVPEDHEYWETFLLLLEIVKISTSKVLLPGFASVLKTLIADHHQMFQHCYPNASMTPKMHYMVHFPQQLKR